MWRTCNKYRLFDVKDISFTMKHSILFFVFSALLTACSECECRVNRGEPNFSVKMSYTLVNNGFNVFSEDTALIRYTVTLHPNEMSSRSFIGEVEPNRRDEYGNKSPIKWFSATDGELVNNSTEADLRLCMRLNQWGNEMATEEVLEDIRIDLVVPLDSLLDSMKTELKE